MAYHEGGDGDVCFAESIKYLQNYCRQYCLTILSTIRYLKQG